MLAVGALDDVVEGFDVDDVVGEEPESTRVTITATMITTPARGNGQRRAMSLRMRSTV